MVRKEETRISPAVSPTTAVTEWFEQLGKCCAAEEYVAARELIADDVVSFGTSANIVDGRERLEANQWSNIWPYITDFGFDLDSIRAFGSGDHGWGVSVWTSTGYTEGGEAFHRPGRATVVVERRETGWQAVHTHFSLFPGTPQETHGPPE